MHIAAPVGRRPIWSTAMPGVTPYRRVQLLGWGIAALVLGLAAAIPVGYFCLRWDQEKALGRIQAGHLAREVAHSIVQAGDNWREHLETIAQRTDQRTAGSAIFGIVPLAAEDMAAQAGLSEPAASQHGFIASTPVMRDARQVATVEVRVSPDTVIRMTALIALLTLLPGCMLVAGLYAWPLRVVSRARDTLTALTMHDSVTGLPNRTAAVDLLADALEGARYRGDKVGVIRVDLLRFRDINDSYGRDTADRLLKLVGERMCQHVQISEQLVHMGGDEFMLLVPAVVSVDQVIEAAERLATVLAAPFMLGAGRVVLTARLGIAISSGAEDDDAGTLMQHAALALRAVKNDIVAGGPARIWHVFNPASDAGPRIRQQMKEDLVRALREKQFRLVYQPQVNLQSGLITGAEALLRWDHPTRGSVPPDMFIPAAEEAELIVEIGAFVLWEACAQAIRWPGLTVAVNVSPVQFQQPHFVSSIRAALDAFNLLPTRLELEITENMLMTRTEESLAKVAQLRALGVRIVIDDFGVGYANIGMLRRFRFNKIKIDRSFVSDVVHDPQARSIVRAMVEVGRALGVVINAEGVEEEAQSRLLRAEGCEEVQGYLYGAPMPPEDFTRLLLTSRPALRAVKVETQITAKAETEAQASVA